MILSKDKDNDKKPMKHSTN